MDGWVLSGSGNFHGFTAKRGEARWALDGWGFQASQLTENRYMDLGYPNITVTFWTHAGWVTQA